MDVTINDVKLQYSLQNLATVKKSLNLNNGLAETNS